MVFIKAWDKTYGGLMLPYLIHLIIIFESWVMGILQQSFLPSWDEGFFIVFLNCVGPVCLIILTSLYLPEIFVAFEHLVFLIIGSAVKNIRCFELHDLTITIDSC